MNNINRNVRNTNNWTSLDYVTGGPKETPPWERYFNLHALLYYLNGIFLLLAIVDICVLFVWLRLDPTKTSSELVKIIAPASLRILGWIVFIIILIRIVNYCIRILTSRTSSNKYQSPFD